MRRSQQNLGLAPQRLRYLNSTFLAVACLAALMTVLSLAALSTARLWLALAILPIPIGAVGISLRRAEPSQRVVSPNATIFCQNCREPLELAPDSGLCPNCNQPFTRELNDNA